MTQPNKSRRRLVVDALKLAALVGVAVVYAIFLVSETGAAVLDATGGRFAWLMAGGVWMLLVDDLADTFIEFRRTVRIYRNPEAEEIPGSELPAGMTSREDYFEAHGGDR